MSKHQKTSEQFSIWIPDVASDSHLRDLEKSNPSETVSQLP